jgi:hypothetical protein
MITAHTTVEEGVRFAMMIDAPAVQKIRIKNKIGIALFAVGPDALLVEKILEEIKKSKGEPDAKAKAKTKKSKGEGAGAGGRGSA